MVERTGISGILIGIAPRVLGETVLAMILADGLTAALTWQFIGMGAEAKFAASTFWVAALAISTIVTGVITPIFAAVMAITLSQLREARDELAHISQRDSLTGLLNRRGFELATTRAFSAARSSGAPLAALMCDIDFFKAINDRFGHDFGDVVLTMVANVIRDTVGSRPSALGRHGGEEFAILLPNTDFEEARTVAETVRAACASHDFTFEGRSVHVTISIGIAIEAPNTTEIRAMLGRADAALYQAKREGRNRVASFVDPILLARAV